MPRLPIIAAMVKIVLRGHILAQPWSIGLWADSAGAGVATSSDCVAGATALAPAAITWANTHLSDWSTATRAEALSVYAYASNALSSHANGTFTFASPVVGTGSGGTQPAFVSAVHTLLTPNSGASFRGRMYVPITNSAEQPSTHQWQTSQATTWATTLAALLTTWQSITGPVLSNYVPVVASFTKGTSTAITAVRVDTMPDTQHRRENKLAITGYGNHSVP
jgi:hypothetical protein